LGENMSDIFIVPVAIMLGFLGFVLLLIILALLDKLPPDEGY